MSERTWDNCGTHKLHVEAYLHRDIGPDQSFHMLPCSAEKYNLMLVIYSKCVHVVLNVWPYHRATIYMVEKA